LIRAGLSTKLPAVNQPQPGEVPFALIQEAQEVAARGDVLRARRLLAGAQDEVLQAAHEPYRSDPVGWWVAGLTAAALAVVSGLTLFH
jgi:hypothetical protein